MSEENSFSKNSQGDFKPPQQNKKTKEKKIHDKGLCKGRRGKYLDGLIF